jgi:hypothetical protein
MEFKLRDLLASVGEQMRVALKERLIAHPGEIGVGREAIIRDFLQAHLPERFGVSHGFVFDPDGVVSRQMDVLIYDKHNVPRFRTSGGQYLFPAEAVVCAGQVKSSLTSKRAVENALENLQSVKKLNRTSTLRVVGKDSGHRDVDRPYDHLDEIFTFVFVTGRSLESFSLAEILFLEYCMSHDRTWWPNMVYSFDKYLLTYICPAGICPNTHCAEGIGVVDDADRDVLLFKFFAMLARAAQITSVWKFSYFDHLYRSTDSGMSFFRFEDSPLWVER